MIAKHAVLWIAVLPILFALAPHRRSACVDQLSSPCKTYHAARAQGACPRGLGLVQDVLQAGGVSAARSRQAGLEFRVFANQLSEAGHVCGSERQQAQSIHRFVHERILQGKYETSANDIAAVLAGGSFNCLTASVLFLALAADFDLEAQAVAVPGHVWCRVASPGRPIDVETTCPHWFELAVREPVKATAELEQFMAEHNRRSAVARVLDRQALIATVHYNRGVRFLKEQQFSAAAAANLRALEIDPRCAPAYDNLLATINNWSVALAARGERELGLDLLAIGLAWAGDYEPFRSNYRYFSQRQAAGSEPPAIGDRVPKSSAKRVLPPSSIESKTGF